MLPGASPPIVLTYFGLPLVTATVGSLLALWIYRTHWGRRGAKWFTALLVAGVIWNLAHLGSLLATGPLLGPTMHLRLLAANCTAVAFVAFAAVYTGRGFHRHPAVVASMALGTVGYVALWLTSPIHAVPFVDWTVVSEPFAHPALSTGVGYDVGFTALLVVSAYAAVAMVRQLLSTRRATGGQLVLLALGWLSTVLAEVLGRTMLVPLAGSSHAVYGTLPFVVFTFLALFRFRLLDVLPVARNALVEDLADPVLVLDRDRRIVDYNAAATALWSGVADGVGEPVETVCPDLMDAIGLDETDPGSVDQVTLSVGDEWRHYSVTVSAVAGDGRRDGEWVSILLRDVTALERSRRQLQSQNERLDQVASTISHDLRNPINVAGGHVELLDGMIDDDGLDAEQVPRARESLVTVEDTHDRMLDIIDDVLTMAREGKTVEETEPLSLAAVARDAWGNVDTGAGSLSIAADATVRADRSKLLTIFENLFRNAVEHGSDDVTVEVGAVEGGFAIADDGPGIPASHADDVFEYGYSEGEGGTGLGLAIVRTMAESHGWSVALDDEYDDGARFVFDTVDAEPAADRASADPVPTRQH